MKIEQQLKKVLKASRKLNLVNDVDVKKVLLELASQARQKSDFILVENQKDLDSVITPDVHQELGYVMEAIKMTKEKLNDEIPLIGFAGSPWTILC